MSHQFARRGVSLVAILAFAAGADLCSAQAPERPSPPPIPPVVLGPTLPTHPVRRTASGFVNQNSGKTIFNERWVDASLLPRDKQGIWVLDFAFKPVRLVTVDVPGKGRRQLHYMYYQVINKTGKPRMFVPQFTIVTDNGKRFEDTVNPQGVKLIQAREDPSIPLLGAVEVVGMIPASEKQGVDDAVFGVAVWENVDPTADRFSVYVRGLSDGYQVVPPPEGSTDKPTSKFKTLRIDFIRRGDQFDLKEREIQLLDPAHEWIYW
ncbi:MAG: hypothetical protein SFX72_07215 [Isosphaeraceae bacterium]|nr:hypothetical protein [Isosphaeraceae bacterium]